MRACWLKWVGRDWSISADYIWLIYSDANSTKGVVMFWSHVQLDDGTQFAYSETREDGTVRVAVCLARSPEASKRPIAILTCT